MGRSNTLPISHSNKLDNNGYTSNSKPRGRSSTTITSKPRTPEPTKHHIPLVNKLPHIPIPFKHHDHEPTSPRPGALNRQNSVQTRYMNMLLAMDTIPRLHNILASFFSWILLAGFLVFPGTFTSLKSLDTDPTIQNNTAASSILKTAKNIPLIYVGAICCGIGAGGMLWLWFRWRSNFVWLLNRIFLPGCLNSFAGLISTLINVYSQQSGNWSTTAWVTAAVTGACMVITGVLFVLYNFWILERVKRRHGREMESAGGEGEGWKEKIERKANEPGLEPGSVV